MLDPKQFPFLMLLSALASISVAAIVYHVFGQWPAAVATGIALFIADWLGIKGLMK